MKLMRSLLVVSFWVLPMQSLYPLFHAVDQEDVEAVKRLLAQPDTDVNSAWTGKTPLHRAIMKKNEEIIKLLLADPRVNVRLRDQSDLTPFILATLEDPKALALLIKARNSLNPPIDINEKCQAVGWTALNLAVYKANLEAMHLLLALPEIDPNVQTKYTLGATAPLHILAERKCRERTMEMAQALIEKGALINLQQGDGKTALDIVTEYKQEVLPYISPEAILSDCASLVCLLLAHNARIDTKKDDQCFLIDLIISNFITKDLSELQKELIALSMKGKQEKLTSAMLENKEVLNTQDIFGFTPLMWAAARNHALLVNMFLKTDGINVNLQDKHGNTALHWAVRNGNDEVVQFLVKRSSTFLSLRNNKGETPRMIAVKYKMLNMANYIKENLERKREKLALCLLLSPDKPEQLSYELIREIVLNYH
jgi:ankyrin repeat protein